MFWINFEWLVFAKPYNLGYDEETIRLNPLSLKLWQDMPHKYQGMAIVLEVTMER